MIARSVPLVGALAVWAFGLLWAGPAQAHPPPRATAAAISDDGGRLAVRLERGIVVSDDAGATWRLRCGHGAGFGLGDAPAMLWVGDELLLATPRGPILDAAGCARRPAWPALDGVAVSALAKEGPTVWLATSQAGADNQLWRSDDAGVTWSPSGEALVDTFVGELAAADGGRLYAAGVALEGEAGVVHFVRHTDDGGGRWEGGKVALGGREHRIALLGSPPGAADVVFVAAKSYAADQAPDRVLRSVDGGRVFDEVWSVPGVAGLAADGDTIWLATAAGLAASEDGGSTFAPVSGLSAPLGCARVAVGALYLCGEHLQDHFGLARWSGDGAPETVMAWSAVTAPVECGEDLCAADWTDWVAEMFPEGRVAGIPQTGEAGAGAGEAGCVSVRPQTAGAWRPSPRR